MNIRRILIISIYVIVMGSILSLLVAGFIKHDAFYIALATFIAVISQVKIDIRL